MVLRQVASLDQPAKGGGLRFVLAAGLFALGMGWELTPRGRKLSLCASFLLIVGQGVLQINHKVHSAEDIDVNQPGYRVVQDILGIVELHRAQDLPKAQDRLTVGPGVVNLGGVRKHRVEA